MNIDRTVIVRTLDITARLILAAVFMLSAIGKITAPSGFDQFVESIPVFSALQVSLIRWVAIGVECALAITLLVPATWRFGAAASMGLLVLFTVVLMAASNLGVGTSCGCFGEFLPPMDVDTSILRNIVLVIFSGLLLSVPRFGKNQTEK